MFKRTTRFQPDRDGAFMEPLEPRVLLTGDTPFLSLGSPEITDPNNSIVRIETNFGDIDIELFDVSGPNGSTPATATVDNYFNYLKSGRYDETFFHRLAPGFVLQGGRSRFTDENGLEDTLKDPPIANEFDPGRSNVERTIAMAKVGGDPDSATSEFFFNLADNSANLDNQNGGFTVFARVIQGWSVVQTISSLPTDCLDAGVRCPDDPSFTGTPSVFANVPFAGDPSKMPIRDNPSLLVEDDLVEIKDIEVIKRRDVQAYFSQTIFYPEGFANSASINEFLPIENFSSATNFYQVIARYAETKETGFGAGERTLSRDEVIFESSIGPNRRGGFEVHRFTKPASGRVRLFNAYALEIQSTLPLAANLSHFDFGTATGEAFSNTVDTNWSFANVVKTAVNATDVQKDFIIWYDPVKTDAVVKTSFFPAGGGAPISITSNTEGYRRRGLDVSAIDTLPAGEYTAVISSNVPIQAALTHFDPGEQGTTDKGFTEIGLPGAPSTKGAIPMALTDATRDQEISIVNSSDTSTTIVRLFSVSGTDTTPRFLTSLSIPARGRKDFELSSVVNPSLSGVPATIIYETITGFPGVFVHTTQNQADDELGYPAAINLASEVHFAEGFLNPQRAGTDVFETLSVFYPAEAGTADATVDVTFRYNTGETFVTSFTLVPGARKDLNIETIPGIFDQGSPGGINFFYSIGVTSTELFAAQFWHFDLTLGGLQPSGGFGTLGTPVGTQVRLDSLGGPST